MNTYNRGAVRTVLLTSVALGACLAAASADAQDTAAPAAADPNVVVVTGVRNSVKSAMAIKRAAPQIVDSIVAEDIGKLPDNNASEAVARIPGIQVERSGGEANNVLIRGLSTIVTTVNDREIFTTTGRKVAIQDFPADSVSGLDVYKTSSANQLDGGIAGLINVRLRRPLDFKGFTMSGGVRATYSTQSRETDPIANFLVSDRWSTAHGDMGVLLNLSYQRRHFFDSVRFDGNEVALQSQQVVTPASVGRNYTFPNQVGFYYNRGDRERPSANASFQWRPSDTLEVYADFLYEGYRNKGDADFLGAYIADNALFENVTLNDTGQVMKSFTTTNAYKNGPSKITDVSSSDTSQFAVGTNWTHDRLKVTAEIAYTDSKAAASDVNIDTNFLTPGRIEVFNTNAKGSVDFRFLNDLNDPTKYTLANMYDGRSESQGNSTQARLDAKYDLGGKIFQRLDFGLRYSDRSADYQQGDRRDGVHDSNGNFVDYPFQSLPGADQAAMVQGGFVGSSIQQQRTWYTMSYAGIRDNLDALRTLIYGSSAPPAYNKLAEYHAKEKTYTAYGQAAYGFDIGSVAVDGLAGVRVVKTQGQLDGFGMVNNVLTPIEGKQEYTDTLPSISARVHFTDKLQLRLAVGKTVTRPDFSSLNPSVVLNSAGANYDLTGYGGNPNLKPTRATNYDASLEYYFSKTSSASLAAFQRDVTGFVTYFSTQETFNNQSALINRPYSAGSGKLKGLEGSYTTFFDSLPAPFDGLGVQVNGTYVEGTEEFSVPGVAATEGTFPGVSRYAYNLVAMYEKGIWSARLAYNWRDKWITNYTAAGTESREYTAAVSRLDFSGSVKLSDHLTMTVDGTNLLKKPFQDYFGSPIYPRDVRWEDSVYSIGLRYRY